MSRTEPVTGPSERVSRFGRVMFERATGAVPEMDCARSIAKRIAEFHQPGARVLDVGCGAGHYLRSLRARVDEEIDYQGVDINPEYVDLAREAYGDRERFQVADIHRLPFEDGSFDLVFASNVLPNLPPPPRAALAELLRVSRSRVLLRTLFGPLNYVIREYVPAEGGGDHLDESHALFNNIYSESFYRSLVAEVDPTLEIEIQADEDWGRLDNGAEDDAWRTRAVGGMQVAGQLLLDWRFLCLRRPGQG